MSSTATRSTPFYYSNGSRSVSRYAVLALAPPATTWNGRRRCVTDECGVPDTSPLCAPGLSGVQGFQVGGLAAPVQQRAAVSMAGGKNFGNDPKDFPEKKVWTTVASSGDLKVRRSPRTLALEQQAASRHAAHPNLSPKRPKDGRRARPPMWMIRVAATRPWRMRAAGRSATTRAGRSGDATR